MRPRSVGLGLVAGVEVLLAAAGVGGDEGLLGVKPEL